MLPLTELTTGKVDVEINDDIPTDETGTPSPVNNPTNEAEPPPVHWSIFTKEPSYPTYPVDELEIHPVISQSDQVDTPLGQRDSQATPQEPEPNLLFQPFNSVEAKLTSSAMYDESTDISTTYIGAVKKDGNPPFKPDLEYSFDTHSFTTGTLPNGKEFRILIDTGATRSYLSKSFYDSNVYLHKFPKIKPKTSCIFMGNGEWVPTLFIIPMCFSIENHAFEVYTIICPMANSDFIWGTKNVVETEGQLCT